MASTFASWFTEEYMRALNLAKVPAGVRFRKFLDKYPVENETYVPVYGKHPMTGYHRCMNFVRMKAGYSLSPDGYKCMALTVALAEKKAIYAYAYWRKGKDAEDDEPEYVCLSPTYQSLDGEFRNHFLKYKKILALYDEHNVIFSKIEKYVLQSNIHLLNEIYPHRGTDKHSRLPLILFVLSLFINYVHLLMDGVFYSHVAADYRDVMCAVYPAIARMLRKEDVHKLVEIRLLVIAKQNVNGVTCGQKFIPLYQQETIHYYDSNFCAWREIEASQAATELVVNLCCPGLSMYNQWLYVEGADINLFENDSMKYRYRRDVKIQQSVKIVRAARAKLHEPDVATDGRVKVLDAILYEGIENAQSYMLVSNTAICNIMEDVGIPMRSLPQMARAYSGSNLPLSIEAFSTEDLAARVMFELCYSAHCLHEKTGIAHTDLHGNNMTMFPRHASIEPFYSAPCIVYIAGPGGEVDTYVFPMQNYYACIIDQSRSILGPGFRPRLENGRTPMYADNFYRDQVNRALRALHRYAPVFVAAHQETLKAVVINSFEKVFPILCLVDFIAIGRSIATILEDAVRDNAEDEARGAYGKKGGAKAHSKVSDAAETSDKAEDGASDKANEEASGETSSGETSSGETSSGETSSEEVDDSDAKVLPWDKLLRPFRVDPAAISLARRLEEAALERFLVGLRDLVETLGGPGMPVVPFPGPAIFRDVFGPWQFTQWCERDPAALRRAQPVDLYNFNNPLRYSAEDYARWPPWARLDEIEKHLGGLKITDLVEEGLGPFLHSLRPNARADVVAERLRAALEKEDGSPATAAASSWLTED